LEQTSPLPIFFWFEVPAQHCPAARLQTPDQADITHSLQFPPKEAEMANVIACSSFLAWLVVGLARLEAMFWSRAAPWASNNFQSL